MVVSQWDKTKTLPTQPCVHNLCTVKTPEAPRKWHGRGRRCGARPSGRAIAGERDPPGWSGLTSSGQTRFGGFDGRIWAQRVQARNSSNIKCACPNQARRRSTGRRGDLTCDTLPLVPRSAEPL